MSPLHPVLSLTWTHWLVWMQGLVRSEAGTVTALMVVNDSLISLRFRDGSPARL